MNANLVKFLLMLPMVVLTVLTLVKARRDLTALKVKNINGDYRFWAWQCIRREVIRLVKHLAILIALFAAIPGIRDSMETNGVDVVAFRDWIFVFIGVFLGVNSGWELLARTKHPPERKTAG
jgi:hypothetical protein